MRTIALLLLFAPIRLCSFNGGGGEIIWFETGDWEEEVWGDVRLASPRDGSSWCVGDTMRLEMEGEFGNVRPEDVFGMLIANDFEVCAGFLDASGTLACERDVTEADIGTLRIDTTARDPNGFVWVDQAITTVTDCADVDTEVDTDGEGPAAVLRVTSTSPQPSSVWSVGEPIPFVASVQLDGPVQDMRVTWQVDGLDVPGLAGRTNTQGTVVRIATFDVGPHEAVATVSLGGFLATASTRFVVTGDTDTDTDTDTIDAQAR